jgi:hypothetical protein
MTYPISNKRLLEREQRRLRARWLQAEAVYGLYRAYHRETFKHFWGALWK